MKLTEKLLLEVAGAFNDVMGLDPAIPVKLTKKYDLAALEAEVRENLSEIDKDQDTFPEEVQEAIDFMNAPPAEEKKSKRTTKEASKAEKKETPKAEEKDTPKTEKKESTEVKPLSQTALIRKLLKSGKKKPTILKRLVTDFEKSEAWATNRMKLYEKSYGEMGKDDPKLD